MKPLAYPCSNYPCPNYVDAPGKTCTTCQGKNPKDDEKTLKELETKPHSWRDAFGLGGKRK